MRANVRCTDCGLRFRWALLDGQSGVRVRLDPAPTFYGAIEVLSWEGDDPTVRFLGPGEDPARSKGMTYREHVCS